MLRIIAFALLSLVLRKVGAGGLAPIQNPDDWSDAPQHFLIVGVVPGLIVGNVFPAMNPVGQFALCAIPGLFHEFVPTAGNVWSRRDLLVNSLGCGVGLWASTGFSVGATPSGVQVTYSWRFQ